MCMYESTCGCACVCVCVCVKTLENVADTDSPRVR